MKAKIIKTGEIVNVTPCPTWYKEDGQGPDRREWDEDELEFIYFNKKTEESLEVDLEKEIDNYINEHFSECEDGVLISDANSKELTLLDITPMARHFYELGLKKGE